MGQSLDKNEEIISIKINHDLAFRAVIIRVP